MNMHAIRMHLDLSVLVHSARSNCSTGQHNVCTRKTKCAQLRAESVMYGALLMKNFLTSHIYSATGAELPSQTPPINAPSSTGPQPTTGELIGMRSNTLMGGA